MSRFVVDASVALSWFLDDESDGYATQTLRKISSSTPTVPVLWAFEIANALAMAERRSRITELETGRVLALVRALPLEMDEAPVLTTMEKVIELSRRHRISAYDAAYLELAVRLAAPLATLDRGLERAAKKAGVSAA